MYENIGEIEYNRTWEWSDISKGARLFYWNPITDKTVTRTKKNLARGKSVKVKKNSLKEKKKLVTKIAKNPTKTKSVTKNGDNKSTTMKAKSIMKKSAKSGY